MSLFLNKERVSYTVVFYISENYKMSTEIEESNHSYVGFRMAEFYTSYDGFH